MQNESVRAAFCHVKEVLDDHQFYLFIWLDHRHQYLQTNVGQTAYLMDYGVQELLSWIYHTDQRHSYPYGMHVLKY